jgi:hypothetical protein
VESARDNTTVSARVWAGTVTEPAPSSTVPADARAMLFTKAGSSKVTGPEGSPVTRRVTVPGCQLMPWDTKTVLTACELRLLEAGGKLTHERWWCRILDVLDRLS